MLINAKTLKGYKLNAIDGDIGSVEEFFFDDKFWTIRYLVANTGGWISGRQVLISPYFLQRVNFEEEFISVDLTKDQIENSPPLESDMPISRKFEESYYGYYGSPVYWGGPYVWGPYPYVTVDREKWDVPFSEEKSWDPNLRSTRDVTKHRIQASDDEIGHVSDFIIDNESWTIRYLIIDTKKFLPGKKVLISPEWIDSISDSEAKVFVQISRDAIKNAPEYDEDEVITRDYESRLYQYYNMKGYWTAEPVGREYHHHR